MHGELRKARCLRCRSVSAWDLDLEAGSLCPACGAVGRLRPHIVWFGEMPLDMPRIFEALERCDLFVAIGTNGVVYPAAGFVQSVSPGAETLELNLEASAVESAFHASRQGPATELVPAWVDELLGP
jgi:NAD-dependent deacetylase